MQELAKLPIHKRRIYLMGDESDLSDQVAQQFTYQCFNPLQSRWGPRGHISPSHSFFLQSCALLRYSIWIQLRCMSGPFLFLPKELTGTWQMSVWWTRVQAVPESPACLQCCTGEWLHGNTCHRPYCSAFKFHHRVQSQHYKAAV